MRAFPILASGLLAGAAFAMLTSNARADMVIKNPHDHLDYRVELEPHFTVGLFQRYYGAGPGNGVFGTPDVGGGFRATIEIVDPGFIPKLNNTVGITFGLDVTTCQACSYYYYNYPYYGTSPYYHDPQVYLPEVGIQWNFWLTPQFSAFADIGIQLRSAGFYQSVLFDGFGMLGGRWHFAKQVALTGRIGYPFFTIGVSFFI